jgi:CBS domain-containing protein
MPLRIPEVAGGRHMNAADVMVSNVITVGPDATVQEVAGLLLKNRISAVPVVSQSGDILGIVSEGDMLRRVESHTLRHRSWWLRLLTADTELRNEFVKSHSHKVVDVMTRKVLTVSPETPLGEIASVLEKNGIKRVPVVKDGKLVGIVSRANLLQAIATIGTTIKPAVTVDDAMLREKVISQLDRQPLSWRALINVIVHDGAVELWGMVDSESEKRAARVAAEVTPGVRAVADNLIVSPLRYGYQ